MDQSHSSGEFEQRIYIARTKLLRCSYRFQPTPRPLGILYAPDSRLHNLLSDWLAGKESKCVHPLSIAVLDIGLFRMYMRLHNR